MFSCHILLQVNAQHLLLFADESRALESVLPVQSDRVAKIVHTGVLPRLCAVLCHMRSGIMRRIQTLVVLDCAHIHVPRMRMVLLCLVEYDQLDALDEQD